MGCEWKDTKDLNMRILTGRGQLYMPGELYILLPELMRGYYARRWNFRRHHHNAVRNEMMGIGSRLLSRFRKVLPYRVDVLVVVTQKSRPFGVDLELGGPSFGFSSAGTGSRVF